MKLQHAIWDRMMVKEYCELMYVPSIFVSFKEDDEGRIIKIADDYINGEKKAKEKFDEIMADPEKVKKITWCYTKFLNDKADEDD